MKTIIGGRPDCRKPPPPLPIDLEALGTHSQAFKTFTGPAPQAEDANAPGWRQADIGAANGHGNARSMARVTSVVARGGEVTGSACSVQTPST